MSHEWSVPFARLGQVDLFICVIGPRSAISDNMIEAALPDHKLARMSSRQTADDRARVARSRTFLRLVLSTRLGVPAMDLQFGATAHGKPFLVGPNRARSGPLFSFSRARDRAAVALSDTRAVGVDIEERARLPQDAGALQELVDASCRPEEIAFIGGSADPRAAFLRIWTAKEARMKLTGEGLTLAPPDIRLSWGPDGRIGYVLQEAVPTEFAMLDDLLPEAAVAVTSGPAEVHLLR